MYFTIQALTLHIASAMSSDTIPIISLSRLSYQDPLFLLIKAIAFPYP